MTGLITLTSLYISLTTVIVIGQSVSFIPQPDPTGSSISVSLIACFMPSVESTTYNCNYLCSASMAGENVIALNAFCALDAVSFTVPVVESVVDSFRVTASTTNQYQMLYNQLNQPGVIFVASCTAIPCSPVSGISIFGRVYAPLMTDISSITNACNPCSAKSPVYTVTAAGQQGSITMFPGIPLWSASVNNALLPPPMRAVLILVPFDNIPIISGQTVESVNGFNSGRLSGAFYTTMDKVCQSNSTMSSQLIPQFSQPTYLGQARCLDPITGGVQQGNPAPVCAFDPFMAFTGSNNNQQLTIVSAGTVAVCTCWTVSSSLTCSSPNSYVFNRLLTIAGPSGGQTWTVPVDTLFQISITGWGLGVKQANRDFFRIISPGASCSGSSSSQYNPSGVTYLKTNCPNCTGGQSTIVTNIPAQSVRSADDMAIPKINDFQFLQDRIILTFSAPISALLKTGDRIAIDPGTILIGADKRARAHWGPLDAARGYQISGRGRFGDQLRTQTTANIDDYLYGHYVTVVDSLTATIPVGMDDYKVVSASPVSGGSDWEIHSRLSTTLSLKASAASNNNIVCWGRINQNSGTLEFYSSAGTISFINPPSLSIAGISLPTSLSQIAQPFVVFFSPNNARSALYSQATGTVEIRITFLNLAKLAPSVFDQQQAGVSPILLPANQADIPDATICGLLFGQLALRDDSGGFPVPSKCMYTSIWNDNGISQRRIHLFFSYPSIKTVCGEKNTACFYELELMGFLGNSVLLSDQLIRIETACADCIPTNPYYVIESGTALMSLTTSTPFLSPPSSPSILFAIINSTGVDPVGGSVTVQPSSIVTWSQTSNVFFFSLVPNVGSTIVADSRVQILLTPGLSWNLASDTACSVSVVGTSPTLGGANFPPSAYSCLFLSLPGAVFRYRVIDLKIPFAIPATVVGSDISFPVVFRISLTSTTPWPHGGFDPTNLIAVYSSSYSDTLSVKSVVASINQVQMDPANNSPTCCRSRIVASGITGDGIRPFTNQYGNLVLLRIQPVRTLRTNAWVKVTLPFGYVVDVSKSTALPPGGTWALPSIHIVQYTLGSSMLVSQGSWMELSLVVSNPSEPISRLLSQWLVQIDNQPATPVGAFLTSSPGFLPAGPAVLTPINYTTIQPSRSTLVSSAQYGTPKDDISVFFRATIPMIPGDLIVIVPPAGVSFVSPLEISLLPHNHYFASANPHNDLLPMLVSDLAAATAASTTTYLFPESSCKIAVRRFIDPKNILGFQVRINYPATRPPNTSWFVFLADSAGNTKGGTLFPVQYEGSLDNVQDAAVSFQFTLFTAAHGSVLEPTLSIASMLPTSRILIPTVLSVSEISVATNLVNATLSLQLPPGFKFLYTDTTFSLPVSTVKFSHDAAGLTIPYLTLTSGVSYTLSNPIIVPDFMSRYARNVLIVKISAPQDVDVGVSYLYMPSISAVVNSELKCSDEIVSAKGNVLRFRFQLTSQLAAGDTIDIIGDATTSGFSYDRFVQPQDGSMLKSFTVFNMVYPPGTGRPFHARLTVTNSIAAFSDYTILIPVNNPDYTTASVGAGTEGPSWEISTSKDYRQKIFGCPVLNQMPPISFASSPNRDDRPLRPNSVTIVSAFNMQTIGGTLVTGTVAYPPMFLVFEDCAPWLILNGFIITECRASLDDNYLSTGSLSFKALRIPSFGFSVITALSLRLHVYRNPPSQPLPALDRWSVTLNNQFASQSLSGFPIKQFQEASVTPTFLQVSKSIGVLVPDPTSFPVTLVFIPRNSLPITNTGPLQIRRDTLGLTLGVLNYTANSGMFVTAPPGYIFDPSPRSTIFNDFRDTTQIGNSMYAISTEIYLNKTGNFLTVVFTGNRSLIADREYTLIIQMIPPQTAPTTSDWFIQSFAPNTVISNELTFSDFPTSFLNDRVNFFNVSLVGNIPMTSTVLNSRFYNRSAINSVVVRVIFGAAIIPGPNTQLDIYAPPGFLVEKSQVPGTCIGLTLPSSFSSMTSSCHLNQLTLVGGTNTISALLPFVFTMSVQNPSFMMPDITSQLYWRIINPSSGEAMSESSQFPAWRVFTLIPSSSNFSLPSLAISGSRSGSSSLTNITVSFTAATMEANFLHINVTQPIGFNFSRAESIYDIYRTLTTTCWHCIGLGGVVMLPGHPVTLTLSNVKLGSVGGQSSFIVKTFYIPPGQVLLNPFTNSSTYREEYESPKNPTLFVSGISSYKNSSVVSNYQPAPYANWPFRYPINPRIGYPGVATIMFVTTIDPYTLPFTTVGYDNITYVNTTLLVDCGADYRVVPNWNQFGVKPVLGNLSAVPLIINNGSGLTASYDSAVYLLDPTIASNWTISVPVAPRTNSSASFWTIDIYANGTLFTTTDRLFALPQNTSYSPVDATDSFTSLQVVFPVAPILPRPNTAISLRFSLTSSLPANVTNITLIAPQEYVILSVLSPCDLNSVACGYMWTDRGSQNRVFFLRPLGNTFNEVTQFSVEFAARVPTNPTDALDEWYVMVFTDPALTSQAVYRWGEFPGLNVDFTSIARVLYGSMSAVTNQQFLFLFTVREPDTINSMEFIPPAGLILACDASNPVSFFDCTSDSSLTHGLLLNRTSNGLFLTVGEYAMPIRISLPLSTPSPNFFDIIMRNSNGTVVDGVYGLPGRPITDSSLVSIVDAQIAMNTTQVGSTALVTLSFKAEQSTTSVDAITIVFPTYYYHQIESQTQVSCVNRKFPRSPFQWVDLSSTQSLTFLVDDTVTNLVEMSTGQAIVLNRIPGNQTFIFQFPVVLPFATPEKLNFWVLSFCANRDKIEECLDWNLDAGLTHIPILGKELTGAADTGANGNSNTLYREGTCTRGISNNLDDR